MTRPSAPLRFTFLPILFFMIELSDCSPAAFAQYLGESIGREDPAALAQAARQQGDARRGAVVFYQPFMQCTKCHTDATGEGQLGPELTKPNKEATDVFLVESILQPSKVIKKGFETVSIVTDEGQTITGLLAEDRADAIVIRDPGQNGRLITIAKDSIEAHKKDGPSIMPAGLVNALASRQQFLDLLRYLMDIRDGGPSRALELKPAPSLYAARPLPEYEKRIDHAGMIQSLNQDSFKRGAAIYNRLCINCHGTHDRPGSLPTSLRFAAGKFKSGNDPYTMYQTLTKGFGMMVQQAWMVPEQKYDVIHYVRQAYLKTHNPSQYSEITRAYLDRLPKGDTRGPAPSNIVPWEQMDYGPNQVLTVEVGKGGSNFAYKGNAVRLDAGPGGVSQGRHWMVFDYDTMRMAAVWSGDQFIDYHGINFDGRHNIHPRVVGQVQSANPTGPGWGRPQDGSFEDVRLVGRDDRRYGPLPRDWAHYKGMYYHGDKTIIQYTVGKAALLEMPGMIEGLSKPVFTRTFNIGPRDEDMILQVAHREPSEAELVVSKSAVLFGPKSAKSRTTKAAPSGVRFDGGTRVEIAKAEGIDLHEKDFTVTARIKTKQNGTILASTANQTRWVPDGMTWFIRGGRLAFDIGWVGAYQGSQRVNDGKWHDVAVTYEHDSGKIQFFVDGRPDKIAGRLSPKKALSDPVIRIGFTAGNFPHPTFFEGEIESVRFFQAALPPARIEHLTKERGESTDSLVAAWEFSSASDGVVNNNVDDKNHARIVMGEPSTSNGSSGWTLAGVVGNDNGFEWLSSEGNLRLRIPAGKDPLRFTLWLTNLDEPAQADELTDAIVIDTASQDLSALLHGGPPRWPDKLETEVSIGPDDGPFAVDVLTRPVDNPWFCRMRLTGFDFTEDGDVAIASAWDGSIWRVSGLNQLPGQSPAGGTQTNKISWRRIASGLFQPLGVKIVNGRIYVTCRDQICILHDLNGDGEIDYFENFNNDHQVTDHFHEFAMGLQVDDAGNFYYAKSARHALKALVPHHGTLLRVSKDGSTTDIVAAGFRAANGVCINPDGTFIVTDQEGHWNPKNRINWVKPGGFYGNMFGYHDVTDTSDEAMDQPLCWITNAFDRSPSELLWCDSKKWGPLNGSLLNFSYGYGKIYVVPHEEIKGQMQGGMCELPIPQFPTGVMRGRFHPVDGQLYTCGMFAWAGSQSQPGGFYRARYTDKPVHLPVGLNAVKKGMEITFSGELDPKSATDHENYSVKIWSLKRTANYGSKHYDERRLKVAAVTLGGKGRTVTLNLPDIQTTWCMEIKYSIQGAGGERIEGTIHNTIHNLR